METFDIAVPIDHQAHVAAHLAAIPHVVLGHDKRSGSSKNSDGSEINFRLKSEGVVEVTVTANPNHIPIEELKKKAEAKVKELIALPPVAAGMDFSTALTALKAGKSVYRSAWNPAKTWLEMIPAGSDITVDFLAIWESDGKVAPWSPDADDLMATNWLVKP